MRSVLCVTRSFSLSTFRVRSNPTLVVFWDKNIPRGHLFSPACYYNVKSPIFQTIQPLPGLAVSTDHVLVSLTDARKTGSECPIAISIAQYLVALLVTEMQHVYFPSPCQKQRTRLQRASMVAILEGKNVKSLFKESTRCASVSSSPTFETKLAIDDFCMLWLTGS